MRLVVVSRGGDFLEYLGQCRRMAVEGLLGTKLGRGGRHHAPASVFGHAIEGRDKLPSGVRRSHDITLKTIGDQLPGSILGGRDDRQAARQGFQHDKRHGS